MEAASHSHHEMPTSGRALTSVALSATRMAADGTWTTPVTVPDAGNHRVFADVKHKGQNQTLARDLAVAAPFEPRPLAAASTAATATTAMPCASTPTARVRA